MKDLFPHSQIRDGQGELKETVETALEEGNNVVAHAPTGLGKTAATLPSALAYGMEHGKTTFFLTPRHSQHEIAIETLKQVKKKHNERFVVVDLIGKRHLCEGANMPKFEGEDENACPRHDSTYNGKHQLTDRARRKKDSFKGRILRAEEVKAECDKVCPYEILMHLAAEADVIIGDYFHIFHPAVRDVIFSKSSMALNDCIVIVDEAHNLADRTRQLHSAVLTEKMIESGVKEASNFGFYEEEEKLERLQRELQRMAKHELGMDDEVEIEKDTFKARVEDISDYDHLIEDLDTVAKEVREQEQESVCGDIAEFLDRWTGKEYGFVRTLKKVQYTSQPYLKLSYTCLNPQHATQQPLRNIHSSILMSGTLTPVDMYVDIFGLDEEDTYAKEFDSPFPEENKMNLIVDKVTTQYKERDEKQYQKMAWYILKSAENISGNVGVFFPSYSMRDEVYENHIKNRADMPVFLEDRTMDKEEKNAFLDKFAEKTDEGAILFGVIGGSFGEGVDFPGELMSAVFVVGLPLQRPDLETQALIDFYDEKFGRGWDYGYNFPAINRALQAAGRCIRTHDDEGVVMFMDKRYAWNKYSKALPPENYHLTKAPWIDIEKFFNN